MCDEVDISVQVILSYMFNGTQALAVHSHICIIFCIGNYCLPPLLSLPSFVYEFDINREIKVC